MGVFVIFLSLSAIIHSGPGKQAGKIAVGSFGQYFARHDVQGGAIEWGYATTHIYLEFFLDRSCECLDFSSFILTLNLRDLTLTQVLQMAEFCATIRRTILNGQLLQLMPNADWF